METTRYTLRLVDGEWRTDPREPSLERAVSHVFGQLLRIEDLPRDLPVVGHVQLYGRWCVFVRPARSERVGAILLDPERYGSLGYDPFLVGARAFGVPELQRLVEGDALPQAPVDTTRPIPVASVGDYLPLAYACFLASDPADRQELYLSALPEGVPPERAHLARFTAAAADGQARTAPPSHPPATAAGTRPDAPREGSAPEQGEWFDRPLSRTEEPVAAAAPPPTPGRT